MRKCSLLVYASLIIIGIIGLANTAAAQYWFQTGARGSNDAGFNNGAGISIMTVDQNAINGSMGFWVGEDLSNGAFIQVGYEITNATGYYSSSCVNSTRSVYLKSGVPAWFWEYFQPNTNNNSFCGGIGPNGSAGQGGQFNTYSFRSFGDVWNSYFNGQLIGSVNLGTDNSGPNPPSAFAEYADTNKNTYPLENVTFKDMLFYIGNTSRLVPQGYSVVGYGKGSLTSLPNNYGVREAGNFADYFVVGSDVITPALSASLWKVGYSLRINSTYGNLTSTSNYIAYSTVPVSAPKIVNVSRGVRVIFEGWIGSGVDSYTGNSTGAYITLYGNVTETARWKLQYYLNVTTQYGNVTGAGWYDAGSIALISAMPDIVSIGPGSRETFDGWTSTASTNKTDIYMDNPKYVSPIWQRQYYLNATTPYGNVSGIGWYYANNTANLSLDRVIVQINGSARLAFKNWSNGEPSNRIQVLMVSPETLGAEFQRQYLVTFSPENSQGQELTGIGYYNVSSSIVNSSAFVFSNTQYNIEYFYYKGVLVTLDHRFVVTSPTVLQFRTPVYNIVINTRSVFGTPVNASLNITFRNNTTVRTYLGSNGMLSFGNVPYGFVTGYAQYLGLRQSINLANGAESDLTFFTTSIVEFVVGGIMFIVAIARITAYYGKKKQRPRPK